MSDLASKTKRHSNKHSNMHQQSALANAATHPGHLDVTAASTSSGAIIVLVVLSIARADEHVVAVGGGAEGGPCEGDGGDDDAHNERVLGAVPGAWVALEGGVGGDGRVAEVGGVAGCGYGREGESESLLSGGQQWGGWVGGVVVQEDNASREQATPNGALHCLVTVVSECVVCGCVAACSSPP